MHSPRQTGKQRQTKTAKNKEQTAKPVNKASRIKQDKRRERRKKERKMERKKKPPEPARAETSTGSQTPAQPTRPDHTPAAGHIISKQRNPYLSRFPSRSNPNPTGQDGAQTPSGLKPRRLHTRHSSLIGACQARIQILHTCRRRPAARLFVKNPPNRTGLDEGTQRDCWSRGRRVSVGAEVR